MLSRLKSLQGRCEFAIEIHKERVGRTSIDRRIWNSDGIMKRYDSIALHPSHRSSREAITTNSLFVGFGHGDNKTGFSQHRKQVATDLVLIFCFQRRTVVRKRSRALQEKTKPASGRQKRTELPLPVTSCTRKDRSSKLTTLLFVDCPWLSKPLGALLLQSLKELCSQEIDIDCQFTSHEVE